ncbi:hypothetical protein FHU10_4217 [Serratia fonticola]|uniref:Uncharacterized protein n=1 Tax=Serratia fonticola TaxID=47917 RepID=A0A542BQP0_SERFO|nr:hypothetical protein FHU09_3487 [Serratia fonticola]TQI97089.1 hypothetical protein FHU11_2558 [Serratia fonticola]TVZ71585.1 hypothetical protein FHU10_4217 [Serratia fonticola]
MKTHIYGIAFIFPSLCPRGRNYPIFVFIRRFSSLLVLPETLFDKAA